MTNKHSPHRAPLSGLKQVSTRIERELLKDVRQMAVEQDTTLQEIINSALSIWRDTNREGR